MNTLTKVVGVAFVSAVAALAVASWDIARGRVPVTTSPLINGLLETPDQRTCSRDVSAVVARFIPPGLPRAEVRRVLEGARVEAPEPWFWKPAREENVIDAGAEIGFVRVMRFTAFGNQKVIGKVQMAGDQASSLTARMICPFN